MTSSRDKLNASSSFAAASLGVDRQALELWVDNKGMRVAYGVTVLQRALRDNSLDGIGRYVAEAGAGLARINNLRLLPFVFSAKRLCLENKPSVYDAGSFVRQAALSIGTGREFPMTARRLASHVDLVHSTDHFIPKLRRLPVVATLHDAVPLSHPEWINYSFKALKNALWKHSARWADHVITISESSKRDIIRWFGVPAARISVTPLGVGSKWFETTSSESRTRIRQKHSLPDSFFLFVGTLQPRKNILRLIDAHKSLPSDMRRRVPLVVAGRAGWSCEKEVSLLSEGDSGALRWLKHIPDEDLLPLFQAASAFVFPSLHEGFGLPVLEAFAAGTPVIASNAGSLTEVAGEAAFLVDPLDVAAMADAMRRVIEDRSMADSLRVRGNERARQFPWTRTAELTAEVYRNVLRERRILPPNSLRH